MNNSYDVIILGAGPAGLSCALYLLRANKNVLIIDKEIAQEKIKNIKEIDNYLGIENISGYDLINKMTNHVLKYKKDLIIYKNIQQIYKEKNQFVLTDYNDMYYCTNLVIATGINVTKVISNIDDFVGKGVSYCISCDGFLYKNKKVILIGQKSNLENMKKEFSSLSNNLLLLEISELKNCKILGKDRVEGLENNGVSYNCDGIFIDPVYSTLNLNFNIQKVGKFIKVDKDYKTNIDNIYAIGDVIDKPLRQIVTAASDGAICATSIIKNS